MKEAAFLRFNARRKTHTYNRAGSYDINANATIRHKLNATK
jgi:hypothetical protein